MATCPANKHHPVVHSKIPYDPCPAVDTKTNNYGAQDHEKEVDRDDLAASILHVDHVDEAV
jgi:hypothetical protein